MEGDTSTPEDRREVEGGSLWRWKHIFIHDVLTSHARSDTTVLEVEPLLLGPVFALKVKNI